MQIFKIGEAVSKFSKIAILASLILGSSLYSLTAQAQTVDPQSFKPTVFSNDMLGVYDAEGMQPWSFDLGLTLHYQHDPIVLRNVNTMEISRRVLEHQMMADLVGGFSFFKWLDLGIALPVVLLQSGQGWPDGSSPSIAGLGDIRIVPRLSFLDLDDGKFSMAFIPQLTAPLGKLMDPLLGDKNFTFRPTLALGTAWPWFRASANLIYVLREPETISSLKVDQQLGLRLGVLAYAWPKVVDVIGELSMSTNTFAPFAAGYQNQFEWLGAVRYHGPMGLDFDLGTGTAIGPGFATPDFRIFTGLRWAYALPQDKDGDGLEDDVDKCPEQAEDKDGFQDEDGCPDLDNDGDGVPDLKDKAPLKPEDKDGFQDADGAPDPDNDQDGILDKSDACPLKAEIVNGYQDDDGCPDELQDSDGDGIADQVDTCPQEAEDKDGFEDENGCPDLDNDKDGLLDSDDSCPNKAGPVVNKGCPDTDTDADGVVDRVDACVDVAGPLENRGCPDTDKDGDSVVDRLDNCPDEAGSVENHGCKKKQLVVLTTEKIEILQKVFFATAKAKIKRKSFELLDNVAQVLRDHKEIGHIRVEGHTDSRGSNKRNKKLSQRRADAVRNYLIKKGVDGKRLVAIGWGEEKPIAPNATRKGRAENRRVEFNIGEAVPELQAP